MKTVPLRTDRVHSYDFLGVRGTIQFTCCGKHLGCAHRRPLVGVLYSSHAVASNYIVVPGQHHIVPSIEPLISDAAGFSPIGISTRSFAILFAIAPPCSSAIPPNMARTACV